MIIKLTSANKKATPSGPDKYIFINTRHLLKMGRQEGVAPPDANFVFPYTAIAMIGTPDVVVLETPDLIMDLANAPYQVME